MTGKETESTPQPNSLNKCIRCPECGEEIMMVPILAQMITNIETHIATHKEHLDKEREIHHPREPWIRDDLTEQVLQKAAETAEMPNRNQTWIRLE